jgi:4-hydroxyproline epimerase
MNEAATSPPLRIQVVDSHTAGEPTRCVLSGLPDFGRGPLSERLAKLRRDHDALRRAILCEPRGSDVLVGAYLLEPEDPANAAAVIFFNNAGYLGMCGHGTIGIAVTLAHLGRIGVGLHGIETPVGTVHVELKSANRVSIRNVPAYRHREAVTVEVQGYGPVTGDVAWGGNWFFLAPEHATPLTLENQEKLAAASWAIRRALDSAGITGADGAEIDHIELYSAPHDTANSARNFVLCPGNAYDRSPCGTGTSAKLACLAADGKLQPGETWRQEGILGTVFEGKYHFYDSPSPTEAPKITPTITGDAYITGEATLIYDPADPFRLGIGA